MSSSRLIELTYYDPKYSVRLTAYADTIITDTENDRKMISAIRFGGTPEMVGGLVGAIHGGAAVEARQGEKIFHLYSKPKGYQRQLSHDGPYAVATLMASDDMQAMDQPEEPEEEDSADIDSDDTAQPRKCYIFCPEGDRDRLFEELDRKTAAPLIPEFRDCVLDALIDRGELRQMQVYSLKERLDAWVLDLLPDDRNVVEILERGLECGSIAIPGSNPNQPDGFAEVTGVTSYLNTFGVTVADRIRNQFQPLFDPASEPLSEEVLAVNDYIREKAGYSLYDAQLAVAEVVKRQLDRKGLALIIAECGSGKTKLGSTALGALYGVWAAQQRKDSGKTFNVVMSPSHVTKKWVREIGETLPNTYAMVVRSITDLDRLHTMYEAGDKSVFAVLSKERARDGYMRYPAVIWNQRQRAFLCPDCLQPVEMEISDDGSRYMVNADQFFFLKEHRQNHKCANCGSVLWAPVNPDRQLPWVRIGGYGWIFRKQAAAHLERVKNEAVLYRISTAIMSRGARTAAFLSAPTSKRRCGERLTVFWRTNSMSTTMPAGRATPWQRFSVRQNSLSA